MYTNLLIVLLFGIPSPANVGSVRLTVVTSEPEEFLYTYYHEIRNDDPPSELEQATTNAEARLRICEDISKSGVFPWHRLKYNYIPVDARDLYADLKRPEYSHIFHLVYEDARAERQSVDSHRYINPYRSRKFIFYNFVIGGGIPENQVIRDEYVFVCFLRETHTKDILPYYVSKSYNQLHDRRFVFVQRPRLHSYSLIFLAEKSAEVYARPDFNVELHYLELRKHHELAESYDSDPVCKFNRELLENDQSYRLCAALLGSSYFKNEFPSQLSFYAGGWGCYTNTIAFKTTEGVQAVTENPREYKERMLRCFSISEERTEIYYFSRAYNPHQVFVYLKDEDDDKIYLEALGTSVSFLYEPYNFGEVEI